MTQPASSPNFSALAAKYEHHFGRTLLAVACDVRVSEVIDDWIAGRSTPLPNQAERLRFIDEWWTTAIAAESEDTARQMFIAAPPRLGGESVCFAIREGRFDNVRVALTAALEDQFA